MIYNLHLSIRLRYYNGQSNNSYGLFVKGSPGYCCSKMPLRPLKTRRRRKGIVYIRGKINLPVGIQRNLGTYQDGILRFRRGH